jgi:flavin-dependent dehydrogenase
MPAQIYTVIIVGAGPGGLSAAARAHANHVDYLLFDKGELGNTL